MTLAFPLRCIFLRRLPPNRIIVGGLLQTNVAYRRGLRCERYRYARIHVRRLPHTRPLPLDISKNGCESEPDKEYNGPVGIPNILDTFASDAGFRTTSIWVSVPHYCANTECLQGSLELVRALSLLLELPIIEGDLNRKAAEWRKNADEIVEQTHAGGLSCLFGAGLRFERSGTTYRVEWHAGM